MIKYFIISILLLIPTISFSGQKIHSTERYGNIRVEKDEVITKIGKNKYKVEVRERTYQSNKLINQDRKTIYKRRDSK